MLIDVDNTLCLLFLKASTFSTVVSKCPSLYFKVSCATLSALFTYASLN